MITDSPISVVIDRSQVADPTHGAVEVYRDSTGRRSQPAAGLVSARWWRQRSLCWPCSRSLGELWQSGRLPACRIVTPSVDPWGFYLDDPPRGYAWESFIRERLLPTLQAPGGDNRGRSRQGSWASRWAAMAR